MKILKEQKFYGFRWQDADENIALVFLEDGTWLLVHKNGYAVGQDGTKYYHVSREIENQPMSPETRLLNDNQDQRMNPDTKLVDIGWTTDAKAPMYYPLGSDEAVESIIL